MFRFSGIFGRKSFFLRRKNKGVRKGTYIVLSTVRFHRVIIIELAIVDKELENLFDDRKLWIYQEV